MVAAARAFGAREPDPSVRNPDYLAERLLGPDERRLIAEHPIAGALEADYTQARQETEVAATSNLMLARTRFIDDHLKAAIANGARQVVILGAGFDTRAWRFEDLLKDTLVFEVDYASTQTFKRRRVEEALGRVPSNLTFVEIDFHREKLAAVLPAAGFRPGEKAFFIWEGVCMYLPEIAVRETLRTIAALSAPGSTLAMDFAGSALLDMMNKLPWHQFHRYTTGWGEPWIFGLPEGKENAFFAACGLEIRELLTFSGKTIPARYFTKADGTLLSRGTRSSNRPAGASLWKRLSVTLQMLGPLFRMITSRTKGYAMAELVVSLSAARPPY